MMPSRTPTSSLRVQPATVDSQSTSSQSSSQSTGLGEIRHAKTDDGRVYTAHSTRQREKFQHNTLATLRRLYLGKGCQHRKGD